MISETMTLVRLPSLPSTTSRFALQRELGSAAIVTELDVLLTGGRMQSDTRHLIEAEYDKASCTGFSGFQQVCFPAPAQRAWRSGITNAASGCTVRIATGGTCTAYCEGQGSTCLRAQANYVGGCDLQPPAHGQVGPSPKHVFKHKRWAQFLVAPS